MIDIDDFYIDGYDIDGVITTGSRPRVHDVIITGRSFQEAPETYSMLWRLGIFNPVYFCPLRFEEKTMEASGEWKAHMIKELKLRAFYEDSEVQCAIIRERVTCNVIKVS